VRDLVIALRVVFNTYSGIYRGAKPLSFPLVLEPSCFSWILKKKNKTKQNTKKKRKLFILVGVLFFDSRFALTLVQAFADWSVDLLIRVPEVLRIW